MKNLKYAGLTAAIIFGMTIGASVVPAKYGLAGCGLGSIIIGADGGIIQIFAATTNPTSGSQTFGITTGTSNCTSGKAAFQRRQQEIYVHVNQRSLTQEMAAGNGEKLRNLATLLGCPSAQMAAFGDMTKRNFKSLARYNDSPSKLLMAVKASVKSDRALAACRVI